jgi:predicted amidohydrolase
VTRIGLAQILSRPGTTESNRKASVGAAASLFEQGADIVVLPEMTVPWYSTDRETLAPLAEDLDGATVTDWQAEAARHGGLVVGGFCERSGDDIFNTAVAVGPDGVVAHYRKLHLFDVEKHCFAPGDLGLSVAETAWGSIGLCVCYDLRFVEVVRVLALRGADLICVPTAWVRGFDRRQYAEGELIPHAQGALVQANLSQVFIACSSQVGAGDGVEFLGSSVLSDPYGQVVAGPLSTVREQLEVAEVDLSEARRAQARSPLIQPRADRRTDVYGLLHDGESL